MHLLDHALATTIGEDRHRSARTGRRATPRRRLLNRQR